MPRGHNLWRPLVSQCSLSSSYHRAVGRRGDRGSCIAHDEEVDRVGVERDVEEKRDRRVLSGTERADLCGCDCDCLTEAVVEDCKGGAVSRTWRLVGESRAEDGDRAGVVHRNLSRESQPWGSGGCVSVDRSGHRDAQEERRSQARESFDVPNFQFLGFTPFWVLGSS